MESEIDLMVKDMENLRREMRSLEMDKNEVEKRLFSEVSQRTIESYLIIWDTTDDIAFLKIRR
jgi:hypothetical protein